MLKKTYFNTESEFSRRRPNGGIERSDGELCNRLSITRFMLSLLKMRLNDVALASGRCCPSVRTVQWTVQTEVRDLTFAELETAQNLP
jgi:hypothetical protein